MNAIRLVVCTTRQLRGRLAHGNRPLADHSVCCSGLSIAPKPQIEVT